MEKFVTIVNPNGRKGQVAATSKAAAEYSAPPSERDADESSGLAAPAHTLPTLPPLVKPGKNGSTEDWAAYATDSRNPQALSSDTADQMTRDDLVAHFES